MHRHLSAAFATLCLVSALSAQCNDTNLVTNGDFASVFPLWTVVTPSGANYPMSDVNGSGLSRCLALASSPPANSIVATAPGQVQLSSNTTYAFSVDIYKIEGGCCGTGWSLDVGLSTGGSRTSIATASQGGRVTRNRVSFQFTPPSSGSFSLDLTMSANSPLHIDNVTIHSTTGPFFNIDGARIAGGNANFRVETAPNDFVSVMVSAATASPTPIPGCTSNPLLLAQPLFPLFPLNAANASGVYTTSLSVPSAIAGIPFAWQPVAFGASPCDLGCADVIIFP